MTTYLLIHHCFECNKKIGEIEISEERFTRMQGRIFDKIDHMGEDDNTPTIGETSIITYDALCPKCHQAEEQDDYATWPR